VALTFVTRDDTGGMDLWLSVSPDSGLTWGEPARVNEAAGRVASFGEARPVPAFGDRGRLVVAWSEKHERGRGMPAHLMARASGDGGRSFGPVVRVNDDPDTSHAFHGFHALAFLGDGTLVAAWMDERDLPAMPAGSESDSASLYWAVSKDGGQTWSANRRLTDRLCPCCRLVLAAHGERSVALAYRSAAFDLRDPRLAVSFDGGESFAGDTLLSPDGWKLEACPAVGAALTFGSDGGGHYAWYTEAGGPAVYLAPWRAPQGLAGVKRALRDSLADATRPRAVTLGAITLLGVEGRPLDAPDRTVLAVRALHDDGSLTPWGFLGADIQDAWLAPAGATGALAAWTEKEDVTRRVRLARVSLR
jgi:hypothetical protein